MPRRKTRFRRLAGLSVLFLFAFGIVTFVCFAVLTERRRMETLAAIPTPPEIELHGHLTEALEKKDPGPAQDLRPAMNTIQQWRNLFDLKEKTVNGEDWDAVLDLWYDADGWDDLTPAEVERIGAFLKVHKDFIEALRRVAAAGGPVEAIHPISQQRDIEHVRAIRDCARLLGLNAIYHARAGDTETAVQDCVAGFQLAEALATEPYWLAQATRKTCVSMVFHTLFDAFPPGTLSSRETARLIYQAQAMAGREALALSFQSSLHESKLEFGELLDDGWSDRSARMWNLFSVIDGGIAMRATLAGYASPLGRPWLNRDIARTMDHFQRAIELAHVPYYEAVEQLDGNVEGFSPYARLMGNMPNSSMRSQANMEAQLQLLQIGLTLEQRQAEMSDVPDTLEALSATFPEETLIDPFTGERFRYRPDNGSFLLYSAGRNQVDDGGEHDYTHGDIVWRHD